ncbi:hypothetical protein BGZ76_002787, partial [Entomortierella beljakovae]
MFKFTSKSASNLPTKQNATSPGHHETSAKNRLDSRLTKWIPFKKPQNQGSSNEDDMKMPPLELLGRRNGISVPIGEEHLFLS